MWALRDFWDDIGAALCVGIVLVLGFVAGGTVACMYGVSRPSCYAATADMRLQSRWGFWRGCQVYTAREGWIPIEALRVTTTVDR